MAERIYPMAWKCRKGHVLGVVERNGSHVSRLLLYREAVDLAAEEPTQPEVLGVLDGVGGMDSIRCSVCGAVRDWSPDREALRRLLKAVERNRAGLREGNREFTRMSANMEEE